MARQVESALSYLHNVSETDGFVGWVKTELRTVLPHAALLVTLGNLYGVGSIATHRLSVDFPLTLVEALKNKAGALDDPLMYGWLRSGKPRHVLVSEVDETGSQRRWRGTLAKFGIRSMLIHGVLNHEKRRFAAFQICNPYGGGSLESIRLVSSLIEDMAEAAWRTIDSKEIVSPRNLTGHPTLNLTPTELHIIELLAQGLSNKEIARIRGVSDSTIKTQVQRTGAKLRANRRAEIVAIAMPMLSPLPAQTLIDYGDV